MSNETAANNEVNASEAASNATETATETETKAQRKARIKAAKAKLADKAGKAEAKASKSKKRKSAAERFGTVKPMAHDAWGCRIGSASAVIDGVLQRAKVPMTIQEIHDACKGKGRATVGATRQHVISRLERGQVKLRDGAYIAAVRKGQKPQATETSDESK